MQLTISLAQIDIALGDPDSNLKKADAWAAEAARRGSDVVVFPEMWSTGYDWDNLDRHLKRHKEIAQAVANLAKKHNIWLNGSMLSVNQNGKATNTATMFDPHGQPVGEYSKIHLFGLMDEDQYLAAGQQLTVVETAWGQNGLAICYDLRFAEIFRSYALKGVNLVYLPSEWPNPRLMHWQTLIRARAIENQMYMVAVNRVGRDNNNSFFGHSAIIDPWGNPVIEAGETEVLLTATIDTDLVADVRQRIPVFKDRRPELYQLDQ